MVGKPPTHDPVDLGGTELYIQDLEHHIDELEAMIHWCIENKVIVSFARDVVSMSTELDHTLQPTMLDCYYELQERRAM